jgi:hypothetical protein
MMMNRPPLGIGALIFLCSVTILGQPSLSGKWEGTTGQGRRVSLELKSDGQQLTGTLTMDQQSGAISGGRVTGKTFSFKATVGERTSAFTGELKDDGIELTPQGAKNPVTLKKVAAPSRKRQ